MDPFVALWGFILGDPERLADSIAESVGNKLADIVMPKPDAMDILARAYAHRLSEETPGSPIENKVDKLALICMAMWELLRDKYGLTHEDLLNKTKEIDLRDGVPDAKITILPKKCSNCGRTLSIRHKRCLYCGSEELEEKPSDLL